MTNEIPGRLRQIAARVAKLKPIYHDPSRHLEERDEIRRDLEKLASELADRLAPQTQIQRANPRGVFATGEICACGRIVKVERRGAVYRRGC